jgi:hypothetical protein
MFGRPAPIAVTRSVRKPRPATKRRSRSTPIRQMTLDKIIWSMFGLLVATVILVSLNVGHDPTPVEKAKAESAPAAKAQETEKINIPQQQHNPHDCGDGDTACIRAWYAGYRDGLLGELHQWQTLQPAAVSAIRLHNDGDAALLLETALRSGWYVHDHWGFADNAQVVAAGIAWDEWDALWSCRAAIISFKFALITVAFEHGNDSSASDYDQSLTQCRKRFRQVANLRL